MSRSRPQVKECRWGRSASRALVIHRWSLASFSPSGASILAKERIKAARAVISGQAPWRPASVSCWPAVRWSGLVSRMRAARRGDRCGRVAVQAALVDVADQEVGAALVAALADLPQQVLDRDSGLAGPALAQVVAMGVDEGGAVFR